MNCSDDAPACAPPVAWSSFTLREAVVLVPAEPAVRCPEALTGEYTRPMSSVEEQARRAARASWPGLKSTLADAPGAEDLRATTTPEQRLSMMWELTRGAWALTGVPMPDYARADMPGRVIRPGDR